jgi:ATP-dependent protease ClpP protease subunit
VRGYGSIMSGASIIMQAADIREMSPSSYMMIHDGSVMLDNDMAKAKQWVKAYDDMSFMMYDIYFERSRKKNKKLTKEQIAAMCKDETILNSKQALELGLIDKIYEG